MHYPRKVKPGGYFTDHHPKRTPLALVKIFINVVVYIIPELKEWRDGQGETLI
jgi:hypothetical protein